MLTTVEVRCACLDTADRLNAKRIIDAVNDVAVEPEVEFEVENTSEQYYTLTFPRLEKVENVRWKCVKQAAAKYYRNSEYNGGTLTVEVWKSSVTETGRFAMKAVLSTHRTLSEEVEEMIEHDVFGPGDKALIRSLLTAVINVSEYAGNFEGVEFGIDRAKYLITLTVENVGPVFFTLFEELARRGGTRVSGIEVGCKQCEGGYNTNVAMTFMKDDHPMLKAERVVKDDIVGVKSRKRDRELVPDEEPAPKRRGLFGLFGKKTQ